MLKVRLDWHENRGYGGVLFIHRFARMRLCGYEVFSFFKSLAERNCELGMRTNNENAFHNRLHLCICERNEAGLCTPLIPIPSSDKELVGSTGR